MGDKLRGAIATLSKMSFRSRATDTGTSNARSPTLGAPIQDARHGNGTSENLDDRFIQQAGHKGKYITLTDIDMSKYESHV